MAKQGFSLNFDGILKLTEELETKYNIDRVVWAAEHALTRSKNYVNTEIFKAMENSRYNFEAGYGYSQGNVKKAFEKVANMPVEVVGTVVTAYAGIDISADAEEILFLIYGSPHTPKDKQLYNAIKVKGRIKKNVERIQKDTFTKALTDELDKEILRELNNG